MKTASRGVLALLGLAAVLVAAIGLGLGGGGGHQPCGGRGGGIYGAVADETPPNATVIDIEVVENEIVRSAVLATVDPGRNGPGGLTDREVHAVHSSLRSMPGDYPETWRPLIRANGTVVEVQLYCNV